MKLRFLLSCAILGGLTLPAAAESAGAQRAAQTGYLVVRNAAGDGGHPLVTLVVHGFVLGSVNKQGDASIDVYQLPAPGGRGALTAVGADASRPIRWHGFSGHQFSGSDFRFRAIDGYYRVVVRGSGVYLFAGGRGNVRLRGSTFDPRGDGTYSVNNGPFRSLPKRLLKRQIGSG
jgi:hypothetical protein